MSTYTQSILIAFFYNDYFIIYSFLFHGLFIRIENIVICLCLKPLLCSPLFFYFLSALCLVLLPFPSTRDTCSLQSPDTVHTNLRLFQFIEDILKGSGVVLTSPSTWLVITKQQAFYQAFF
ncbi:hypothetical protein OL548_06235 [Lysinibacillus sp. MHQ-1]|nr:hypothetical protein OL548_06235 [Lysinibacillus sp. MHQ-1]